MEFALAPPAPGAESLWHDLANRAISPAGLARPELAAASFDQHSSARLATVSLAGRWLAALPVAGSKAAISHLSNAGYPLLDTQHGQEALGELLRGLGKPILFTGLPADGPVWEAVSGASAQLTVLASWQRAGLRLKGGHEAWFASNFDRKRRSRYRRNLQDLRDLPGFRFERLKPGEDCAPWSEAFLGLEARGWKGARGTALAGNPAVAKAFRQGVRLLHNHGLLRFWRMTTGDSPVAMVMAIVERGTASFSKIAYDEDHGRLSPGAMIILEATRDLFEEGGISLIDSCAIPEHPLLDNIWRDRLAMCDVLVAGRGASPAAFGLTLGRLRAERIAKTLVRNAYLRFTGARRS